MKIRFVIVGSGWRALYYIRAAKALPGEFELCAVLCRSREKADALSKEYGIHTTLSIQECISLKPDFVVIAVSKNQGTVVSLEWLERGFTVVQETPAAPDFESLEKLRSLPEALKNRFITAEQYHLYPEYSAVTAIIKTGLIGETFAADISLAHDYHAASLIREFLDISPDEDFSVRAKTYEFPVTKTLTRYEEFFDGHIENSKRTAAVFEFKNGKAAFYDFDSEQYRSPIRRNLLRISGSRGEINGTKVYYLDSEGKGHEGDIVIKSRISERKSDNPNFKIIEEIEKITFEGKTLYEAPFGLCGLSQDETAVALLLRQTGDYVHNKGDNPYPLKKALSDSYMALMMHK